LFKKVALLAWGLAFVLTEIIGIAALYLAHILGMTSILGGSIADITITIVRFLILIYIASSCRVSLSHAIYKPLPRGIGIITVSMMTSCVVVLDYFITIMSYGRYIPQLLGVEHFIKHGLLWAFLPKIGYYFSEITVMNYMYILAKRAWPTLKPPITAGIMFLILGWAIPHIITKNIVVALYAIVLVIIFHAGYEYSKSPLTPIVLWFTILTV